MSEPAPGGGKRESVQSMGHAACKSEDFLINRKLFNEWSWEMMDWIGALAAAVSMFWVWKYAENRIRKQRMVKRLKEVCR